MFLRVKKKKRQYVSTVSIETKTLNSKYTLWLVQGSVF